MDFEAKNYQPQHKEHYPEPHDAQQRNQFSLCLLCSQKRVLKWSHTNTSFILIRWRFDEALCIYIEQKATKLITCYNGANVERRRKNTRAKSSQQTEWTDECKHSRIISTSIQNL